MSNHGYLSIDHLIKKYFIWRHFILIGVAIFSFFFLFNFNLNKNESILTSVGTSRLRTVCGEECWNGGTCNEELGRCDCIGNLTGPTCQELAFPSCNLPPLNYIPCYFPMTCACALECEKFTLRPGANWENNWVCYDESKANHSSITSSEAFSLPGARMFTNNAGAETRPREAIHEIHDTNQLWALSPTECPYDCFNRGICVESRDFCRCPAIHLGPYCEGGPPEIPFGCFNDCNDKGLCIEGVCKCERGYFGLDCSIFINSKGKPDLIERNPFPKQWRVKEVDIFPKFRPLIYVYELPVHFVAWLFRHSPGADYPEALLFLESILASNHRTANPEEADFFFIPVFIRMSGNRVIYLERVMSYVVTTWPYWNRTGGSDHLLLTNDDLGNCDFFPRGWRNPMLENMTTLTVWTYTYNMYGGNKFPCFKPGQDIGIPPSIFIQFFTRMPFIQRNLLENPPERSTLMFFEGAEASGGSLNFGALPEELNEPGLRVYECNFLVRQVLFSLYRGKENETGIRMISRSEKGFQYEMLRSVFCLAPPGWGFGMRTTEVVMMNCIPVIINVNLTEAFGGDLLDWKEFAVIVPFQEMHNLHLILKAIPESEIAKKRKRMAEVWPHFVWATPRWNPLKFLDSESQSRVGALLARNGTFQTIMHALKKRLNLGEYSIESTGKS